MMIFVASFLAILHYLSTGVHGFSGVPYAPSTFRHSTTVVFGIRCENKSYQLEEREDRECSTTELFLREDRVIEFGDTDGPVPLEVDGTWQIEEGTDNYSMKIRRKFRTGSDGRDMGEFEFETVREYKGEMTMVGESVAITGVMLTKDDILGDEGRFRF